MKKEIGFETYLNEIHNITIRKTLTKFRLSNHHLKIETGRYNKNKKRPDTEEQNGIPTERACPFCPNQIESEIHFLIQCPVYEHVRDIVVKKIEKKIPGLQFYTDSNFNYYYHMTV